MFSSTLAAVTVVLTLGLGVVSSQFAYPNLTLSDGIADAYFGSGLALDQQRLFVGSPRANPKPGVHMYHCSSVEGNLSCVPRGRLETDSMFYGSMITARDHVLVVSQTVYYPIGSILKQGSVFVFECDYGGDPWTCAERASFVESGETNFGYTTAYNGEILAIGAYEAGVVSLYHCPSSVRPLACTFAATLNQTLPVTPPSSPGFGRSVAFYNTTLFVVDPEYPEPPPTGIVTIYDCVPPGNCTLVSTVTPRSRNEGDDLSEMTVAAYADTVLVASSWKLDGTLIYSYEVDIFTCDKRWNCTFQITLVGDVPMSAFGDPALAMFGHSMVLVGAPIEDINGEESVGAVYAFMCSRHRSPWRCDKVRKVAGRNNYDCLGERLAISPPFIATSAPGAQGEFIYAPGHASVLDGCDIYTNYCRNYTSCESCTAKSACNWCVSTRQCVGYQNDDMPCNAYECDHWDPMPEHCVSCDLHTTCDACVAQAECGWCATTGRCEAGTAAGPNLTTCAQWEWEWADCGGCGTATTCDACAALPECGWCATSGACFRGTAAGPNTTTCADWDWGGGWACYGCENYSDCETCATAPGCGWCASTAVCLPGDAAGPNATACADWDFGHAVVCLGCDQHTSCTACTSTTTCGWCDILLTCMPGDAAGPAEYYECPKDWEWERATCPASGCPAGYHGVNCNLSDAALLSIIVVCTVLGTVVLVLGVQYLMGRRQRRGYQPLDNVVAVNK